MYLLSRLLTQGNHPQTSQESMQTSSTYSPMGLAILLLPMALIEGNSQICTVGEPNFFLIVPQITKQTHPVGQADFLNCSTDHQTCPVGQEDFPNCSTDHQTDMSCGQADIPNCSTDHPTAGTATAPCVL